MPETKTELPVAHARMLNLLDHLSDGVAGLVESGEVVFVNRSLNRLLGYGTGDLTGQPIFTLDPYLNLFTWKKIWKQLVSEGSYYSTSLLMRADGHVIPVKVKAVFDTSLEQDIVLFFIEDELEARSTVDMLGVTSQNAQVGAWEYNLLTGKVTLAGVANEWTDAPEDTLRAYSRGQLFARLDDWVLRAEKRRLLANVGKAIREQSGFSYTFPWKLTDGETLRLCVEGKCEVDQQGEVVKIYGVGWDEKQQARESGELAFLGQFSIEHANDFIFWVREDGSFAYVNQSACQRLGYTWEEFQEIDVTRINTAPPEARATIWEELRLSKSMVVEAELIGKTGDRIPVSAALNHIVFEGEEYNCVFCRDLSEQRERREQLQRTRFALRHINEAIVWVNDQGEIKYANEYFGKLAESPVAKLLAAPIRELFTAPDGQNKYKDFWSWLRQTKEEEWEGFLIQPEGKRIPVYGTLSQLVDEDETLFCLFLRDWRRKRDRERQLQLAQQSVKASHDLVLWIDESYRIEFANDVAQQILQQYRSRYMSTPLGEFLHDPGTLNELMMRSSGIVDFKTDTDAFIPVEFRCSKIEAGNTVVYSLIGRDVTEQRRREEELVSTKEELERMSTQLQQENLLLREEINTTYDFNNIITRSKEYRQKVLTKVAQVANSDATVLILGETGTGKELLARAIHSMSDRDEQVLIKVNCAALPPSLIESELFGHEKGAFTGAHSRKTGRFELASGGTLFLDEAGEMPLDLQAKMLRVLQEGEFERVGGTVTIRVDVRIIAATNRNLEKMVADGTFREDLYYRLNVFPIYNMPLRERREDIPLLVRHFATRYSERLKRDIQEIPAADLELLTKHDFPGNIRELENMVERAVILSSGKVLNLKGGMSFELGNGNSESQANSRIVSFEEMQRRHILAALKQTEGRVTGPEGAARLLQLNDRTLASKMRKLGIKREDYLRQP